MRSSFPAILGMFLGAALAIGSGQRGTSSANLNATAIARANPRPAATHCSSVTCLDQAAYLTERSNLAPNSPEAKLVASIAARIERVVGPIYGAPFHFYVTAQIEPNAYSYYGPRVYISRGMVDFADSREELAGVMCHESSHVLHHDGMRSMRATDLYTFRANAIVRRADALTHRHYGQAIEDFAAWSSRLAQLHYTRGQELAADRAGAHICSLAGSNPWGMVRMLAKIHRNPQMASRKWGVWKRDHPSDKERMATLRKTLRRDAEFQIWTEDMAPNPLRRKRS